MDDRQFRTAMGKFATGVTVITTEVDGKVHGMTANAFMSVSLYPKLVLISVSNKARMHKWVRESGNFAVSILSEEQREMSMVFAGQMKTEGNIDFGTFEGLPVIKDSLAILACQVETSHLAGDHTLFIGKVLNLNVKDGDPLVFFAGKYKQIR